MSELELRPKALEQRQSVDGVDGSRELGAMVPSPSFPNLESPRTTPKLCNVIELINENK